MARRALQPGSFDRLLPAAVVLLLVLSFLPAGLGRPLRLFSRALETLAAPVSQPMWAVASWLAPTGAGDADPEVIAQLKEREEYYKTLYERMRVRNEDLLQQMEQLRLIISLNPDLNVRNLKAPVIGAAADLGRGSLRIRAGSGRGVSQNDVVVVAGVQLYGRVQNAGSRVSTISPITNRRATRGGDSDSIGGQVMIADGRGVPCLLRPTGEGTLSGDVAHDDPGAAGAVAVGQYVRLDDGTWPASAQMLIVGLVESVEPAPDSPLRKVIVVRPTAALDRVTEVIVRISEEDGE